MRRRAPHRRGASGSGLVIVCELSSGPLGGCEAEEAAETGSAWHRRPQQPPRVRGARWARARARASKESRASGPRDLGRLQAAGAAGQLGQPGLGRIGQVQAGTSSSSSSYRRLLEVMMRGHVHVCTCGERDQRRPDCSCTALHA